MNGKQHDSLSPGTDITVPESIKKLYLEKDKQRFWFALSSFISSRFTGAIDALSFDSETSRVRIIADSGC
ncbi:MAG: hypothetical protein WD509_03480 [Candidatus Paceibacterota bacterium]